MREARFTKRAGWNGPCWTCAHARRAGGARGEQVRKNCAEGASMRVAVIGGGVGGGPGGPPRFWGGGRPPGVLGAGGAGGGGGGGGRTGGGGGGGRAAPAPARGGPGPR